MARRARSLEERFWSKVGDCREGRCWPWTASVNEDGYGRFVRQEAPQRVVGAHRMAWELTHGSIPSGLCVLHRCDNPSCCNPAHLFLGTQADNVADMLTKGRWGGFAPSACPAGHPYDQANTRWNGNHRDCRACDRERQKARRLARGLVTPEQRSAAGRRAMHVRWHEQRGIANPDCEFCQPSH